MRTFLNNIVHIVFVRFCSAVLSNKRFEGVKTISDMVKNDRHFGSSSKLTFYFRFIFPDKAHHHFKLSPLCLSIDLLTNIVLAKGNAFMWPDAKLGSV